MQPSINIVGLGPDASGRLLTLEAVKVLSKAQLILVVPRLKGTVKKLCPRSAEILDIDKHVVERLPQLLEDGVKAAHCNEVVIAVNGDPTFASLGSRLYHRLARRGLKANIIPGISSLQLAAAKLGLDWADSLILDLHAGGDEKALRKAITMAELGLRVFTTLSPRVKAENVAKLLSEAGFPSAKLFVCENLGTCEERILTSHACALASEHTNYNAILIIEPLDKRLTYGIKDQEIYAPREVPGPTKEEIRAITACKARLKPGHQVIEVGCGTGALTIELALRVLPNGLVYAVDYRKEAVEATIANVKRYGVAHVVKVVQGKAPEVLSTLNGKFAAAVIGGTRNLRDVIEVLDEDLLVENGRIVINAVTADSLTVSYQTLTKLNYDVEVTCCLIARTRRLKQHLAFSSLNPVFIIVGEKVKT